MSVKRNVTVPVGRAAIVKVYGHFPAADKNKCSLRAQWL
jgi:hypothetical protein